MGQENTRKDIKRIDKSERNVKEGDGEGVIFGGGVEPPGCKFAGNVCSMMWAAWPACCDIKADRWATRVPTQVMSNLSCTPQL